MRILFIASEVVPFSKTGGLGDVSAALPAALAQLGHEVKIVTPRYADIQDPRLQPAGIELQLRFPFGTEGGPVSVARLSPNLEVYFLDNPRFFARQGLYGDAAGEFGDNHRRYAYLSIGALQLAEFLGFTPDILQLNDWQTGLAPLALKLGYGARFADTRSVFTIHNLAYQGQFPKSVMGELGLPWNLFRSEGGLEFYDSVNFLKAGLTFSDALTTVSPTYAREIQTPEGGNLLDGLLRARSRDLHGILNGIDVSDWNPATDRHLPAHFEPTALEGKTACKAALLDRFRLGGLEAPLFAVVSRLAHQKGMDLLLATLPAVLEQDVRVVLLGNGDAGLEEGFRRLQARYPRKVGVHIGFDNPLSHLVEAGADFFLMPSRYEPCGLNQLYSLRYATLPIVRRTGGLADTVQEGPDGTGFLFDDYAPRALHAAMERALALYRNTAEFEAHRQRAMTQDFSWDASARAYEALYRSLLP